MSRRPISGCGHLWNLPVRAKLARGARVHAIRTMSLTYAGYGTSAGNSGEDAIPSIPGDPVTLLQEAKRLEASAGTN